VVLASCDLRPGFFGWRVPERPGGLAAAPEALSARGRNAVISPVIAATLAVRPWRLFATTREPISSDQAGRPSRPASRPLPGSDVFRKSETGSAFGLGRRSRIDFDLPALCRRPAIRQRYCLAATADFSESAHPRRGSARRHRPVFGRCGHSSIGASQAATGRLPDIRRSTVANDRSD
jgi:hypothetical protein